MITAQHERRTAWPLLLAMLVAIAMLVSAIAALPAPQVIAPAQPAVQTRVLTQAEAQSAETLAGLLAPNAQGQLVTHIPGHGRVVWGNHAKERHGLDAYKAIAAAVACGEKCVYNRCADKTKRYSVGKVGNLFFLVVTKGETGVTAFLSTHDLSYRPREEGCVSMWAQRAGHDGWAY